MVREQLIAAQEQPDTTSVPDTDDDGYTGQDV
jgi:hypothetical protein